MRTRIHLWWSAGKFTDLEGHTLGGPNGSAGGPNGNNEAAGPVETSTGGSARRGFFAVMELTCFVSA